MVVARWNLAVHGMALGTKRFPTPVLIFGFMSMAALNITQRMLWIVYWDVSSLKNLSKKKKAVVAAGRPKSVERSFSSLKRIKSFPQNKMEQDRLSDLGFITIESQLPTEVMETKSFQDSVNTKFASAGKRMEFTFK